MVIKAENMQTDIRENMRGGNGAVNLQGLVPSESLPVRSRLFSLVTLEPGCGIGPHVHEGEGVLDDNGEQVALRAGDCNVCGSGAFHAIANESDKPLKFIAVIILD